MGKVRRAGRNPSDYIPGATPYHESTSEIWRIFPGIPHRFVASVADEKGFTASQGKTLQTKRRKKTTPENIAEDIARHDILLWYEEHLSHSANIVKYHRGLPKSAQVDGVLRDNFKSIYDLQLRPRAMHCARIITEIWGAASGPVEISLEELDLGPPVYVDVYSRRFRVVDGERVDEELRDPQLQKEKRRKLNVLADSLAAGKKPFKIKAGPASYSSQMLPPSQRSNLPSPKHSLQYSEEDRHSCDDSTGSSSSTSSLANDDPRTTEKRKQNSKDLELELDGGKVKRREKKRKGGMDEEELARREEERAKVARRVERAVRREAKAFRREEKERVASELAERLEEEKEDAALEMEGHSEEEAGVIRLDDASSSSVSMASVKLPSTPTRPDRRQSPPPSSYPLIRVDPPPPLPSSYIATTKRERTSSPRIPSSSGLVVEPNLPSPSFSHSRRLPSPSSTPEPSSDDFVPIPGGIFDYSNSTCSESPPPSRLNNANSHPRNVVGSCKAADEEEYCHDCGLYPSEDPKECSCSRIDMCAGCQICRGCARDAPSIYFKDEDFDFQAGGGVVVLPPSRFTSLEMLRATMPPPLW